MEAVNKEIFLWLNQFVGKNDTFDSFAVFVGDKLPYLFILTLVGLWIKSQTKQSAEDATELREIILTSGYAAILGIIINRAITSFYFHPRPFMDNLGTILGEHKAEGSFPSDHTTFVFCLAFIWITSKMTQKVGFIFTALALIGGIFRVYSGVHYPFDIIGSFLVSLLVLFSFRTFLKEAIRKLNHLILTLYQKFLIQISKH